MDTLFRDLRYALRQLARQRAFTLTAVATLALGLGANTAMFGIVYGILLRPLPYPDAGAIVRIGESFGGRGRGAFLSNRSMALLEENAESFEQLAAYRAAAVDWAGPDGAVTLRGARVSPSLFPLLRAAPHLGRLFTEEEGRAGADRVVLLGHGAWTNRFGADPDIVGAPVDLGGDAYTVVGVLAEGFYFPNPDGEFWMPFVVPPFTPPTLDPSGRFTVSVVAFSALGRLAPGVSPTQAATEAGAILQRDDDGFFAARNAGPARPADGAPAVEARVVPLLEQMVGGYRPALLALAGATLLVLLIACSNVAGLMLARGVTRQRALAVSAALGAGRGRLVRQLLTESVVLGLLGGALGLAASALVLHAVPALVPGNVARLDQVAVDGAALAFNLGLSVVVGLLFGAAPALQWSRLDLVRSLNEGSVQAPGGFRLLRSNRIRAVLATGQVALALVLLVGAGLLLRSFVGLVTADRGYDPANVVTAVTRNPDFRPRRAGMTPAEMAEARAANRRFQDALVEAVTGLERLPDVEAVGVTSRIPLAVTDALQLRSQFRVAGRPVAPNAADIPQATVQVVTPGYLEAMRLRLRGGRLLTRLDRADTPPVVVVNETLARQLFGGGRAVGERVLFAQAGEPAEVVGVVGDVEYRGLAIEEPQAEAFIPPDQAEAAGMAGSVALPMIAVRTGGDPLAVVPFLAEAVTEAHPRAALGSVMTMADRLSAAVAQPRFYAVFVGSFAALALFLAAFGVYGLLSYTVSERRREIGVRMALGARRADILALVVRQGGGLVAAGAAVGLLAAAASARVLERFLFGIATNDGPTFVAAPLVLVAAGLFACWLPGRRAARIDPMQALRVE